MIHNTRTRAASGAFARSAGMGLAFPGDLVDRRLVRVPRLAVLGLCLRSLATARESPSIRTRPTASRS